MLKSVSFQLAFVSVDTLSNARIISPDVATLPQILARAADYFFKLLLQ